MMDRRFALLLLCFLLSGFSALLYQTAWTREFSFVFGTSEVAVAAVLAGYMGGLALGAVAAARLAPRLSRPVLAYGVLEGVIALAAIAVPHGLRGLTAVYGALFGGGELAEPGAAATVFRLTGAFALMLVPTALMGATLPLLARHAVRRDEQVGPRVGALYATNTAGAIGGTLCAAFVLLPAIGLRHTVYVGAAVNGLVFAAAALLARGAPPPVDAAPAARERGPRVHWILPLMLVSGAVSFSYEVLWTRLLSQLLGGSLYAFATMLASFLTGIALGSAVGGRIARRPERAAPGFALSQIGVGALGMAGFAAADRLPDLAAALGADWASTPFASAPLASVVLVPVALCIGATFPFAVRILAPDPAGTARATARVYAWNTVGAIAGAIGAGFVWLPALGFAGTLALGVSASLALAAATSLLARPRLRAPLVAAAGIAGVLVLFPVGTPWQLLRASPMTGALDAAEIRYYAVGRSSTVLLLEQPGRFKLLTNGLPEAIIEKRDGLPGRGLEARWLGLLPVLLRPGAAHVLVVGLGGGLAVEGVPPTVAAVDVVELEQEVVEANRAIGAERALDPLADPRTRMVVNDARGALQLTDRRYDAIVSQPSHPWTAGASHLYTREFFALAAERLTDDGVFVQWMGLRFVDETLLRSLVATLADVFPHVQLYQPVRGALLLAGSKAPLDPLAGRAALAAAPDHFARYGVLQIEDVAAALVADDAGARALADGAEINGDDHNLLATHSARIRGAALDPAALARLLDDHEPLRPLLARMDGIALVRALTREASPERADDLARDLAEPERQIALGWLAGSRGRLRVARHHLHRALALAPDAPDAHAALLVLGLDGASEGAPDAVAMLRRGQALEAASDFEALEALDPQLAAVAPNSPLFDAAQSLRARWRIESGDPARAAEALEMLDRRVARRDAPAAQLARAGAAQRAGRPDVAWIALEDVSRKARTFPNGAAIARSALALCDELPPHPLDRMVCTRLEIAARTKARGARGAPDR